MKELTFIILAIIATTTAHDSDIERNCLKKGEYKLFFGETIKCEIKDNSKGEV